MGDKRKMTKEQEFRKQAEEAKFEAFSFMCKKVAELEKENAELKRYIKADCIDCADYYKNKRLEKENAELKKLKRECETSLCRAEYQYNYEQLTKAKELLKQWVELFKPKGGNIPPTPIQEQTEQFLNSEVEKCGQ